MARTRSRGPVPSRRRWARTAVDASRAKVTTGLRLPSSARTRSHRSGRKNQERISGCPAARRPGGRDHGGDATGGGILDADPGGHLRISRQRRHRTQREPRGFELGLSPSRCSVGDGQPACTVLRFGDPFAERSRKQVARKPPGRLPRTPERRPHRQARPGTVGSCSRRVSPGRSTIPTKHATRDLTKKRRALC